MKRIPKFKLKPVMSLYENIDWSKPTAVAKKPIVYESN